MFKNITAASGGGTFNYGWIIVIAAAINNAVVGGLIVYGVTAWIDPLTAAFGWSYAQISLAMTLRGLESGAMNPFVGFFADRFSTKKLMFMGTLLVAAGVLLLSQVSSVTMFYVCFVIITLGESFTEHLVPLTLIMRWFHKDMSKAASMFSLGIGLGSLSVPITAALLSAFHWERTMVILAGAIVAVALPMVFFMRKPPVNPAPEPGVPVNPDIAAKNPAGGKSLTVIQSLGTRAFWQIGFSTLCWITGLSAYVLYVMPFLESRGIDRTTASLVAMSVPLISLPSRVFMGWLADRFPRNNVFALSIAMVGMGLFLFQAVDAERSWLLVVFALMFGLGLGGVSPAAGPLYREYFGTKHFGAVYGVGGICFTVGSMSAPPLVGLYLDSHAKAYDLTWLVMGLIGLVGALLMFLLPRSTLKR